MIYDEKTINKYINYLVKIKKINGVNPPWKNEEYKMECEGIIVEIKTNAVGDKYFVLSPTNKKLSEVHPKGLNIVFLRADEMIDIEMEKIARL